MDMGLLTPPVTWLGLDFQLVFRHLVYASRLFISPQG